MRKLLDIRLNEMALSPKDYSSEAHYKKMQDMLNKQQHDFAMNYAKFVEDYFDEKLKIRDVQLSTVGGVNTISIVYKKNIKDDNERHALKNFKKQMESYLIQSYSHAGWADPKVDIWWEEMFKISSVGMKTKQTPSIREPKMIVIKLSIQQPAPPTSTPAKFDIAA